MKALSLVLLLAAPLAAESHWTLRHQSALLGRDSSSLVLGHEESLRWHGGGDAGAWRAEWNFLARALSLSRDELLPASLALPERSRALQGERRASGLLAGLEADQLSLRWQGEQASAVLGRQSVNLGENFFFSPLDLFAPFAPQEAYRDFRAGVDALRLSWSPSAYSLLEAVAVAGWKPSPAGSALPDSLDADGPQSQSSLLLRGQANGEAWSLTALGGRFRDQAIGGGAVQLEFWGASWGFEDLWRSPLQAPDPLWDPGNTNSRSWTLSHSRQWNAWLSSRLEQSSDVENWTLGRFEYSSESMRTAFSLQAQAGPLWNLGLLLFGRRVIGVGRDGNTLHNTDSLSLQVSADRSISNESTLSFSLGLPFAWPEQGPFADSASEPYRLQFGLRTTL